MAKFSFLTHWHLDAPIDDVWDAIVDAGRWPSWWRGVELVTQLQEGDANGVGRRNHMVWKSALPYHLGFDVAVTRVERPHLLQGDATGELEGFGRWDLTEAPGGGTDVSYTWQVRTTRRWMNVLGPLAVPAFRWNHDYVMAAGQRGLAKLLASRERSTPKT